VIEPGRRADLVLIDGDPIADIRATRLIRRVWCAGVEHVVGTVVGISAEVRGSARPRVAGSGPHGDDAVPS